VHAARERTHAGSLCVYSYEEEDTCHERTHAGSLCVYSYVSSSSHDKYPPPHMTCMVLAVCAYTYVYMHIILIRPPIIVLRTHKHARAHTHTHTQVLAVSTCSCLELSVKDVFDAFDGNRAGAVRVANSCVPNVFLLSLTRWMATGQCSNPCCFSWMGPRKRRLTPAAGRVHPRRGILGGSRSRVPTI